MERLYVQSRVLVQGRRCLEEHARNRCSKRHLKNVPEIGIRNGHAKRHFDKDSLIETVQQRPSNKDHRIKTIELRPSNGDSPMRTAQWRQLNNEVSCSSNTSRGHSYSGYDTQQPPVAPPRALPYTYQRIIRITCVSARFIGSISKHEDRCLCWAEGGATEVEHFLLVSKSVKLGDLPPNQQPRPEPSSRTPMSSHSRHHREIKLCQKTLEEWR